MYPFQLIYGLSEKPLTKAYKSPLLSIISRAQELLNAVQQRSDATTTFAPATKNDLIKLILNERRIELPGEGFRSLNIIRQGATLSAKAYAGSIVSTSVSYV